MMADVPATRTDFQYQSSEAAENYEPVIQHVWSQKPNEEKSDPKTTMSLVSEKESHFNYSYDRPTMLSTSAQPCATRMTVSEANTISFVHIAPKADGRRLSFNGSQAETSGSSPSNSPETLPITACSGFGESSSPVGKTEGKKEIYIPSGKNIINDSPWPPDFEPTVKEMRRKLYEFGGKREGIDEPPREEMRKLRQYYAVKFRSWLKDGNRDMSQLLCHYYAVAKMSNRCWERAVSIMEKYRCGLLKDMTKGLPVKQSIFQFVDRGNEEYTFDIMCKVERGETSLQEAKQKYRMILDKRKAKICTAKRMSTIEALTQSAEHEIEKSRRSSLDYDSRTGVVNGLSPAYPPVEQNGLPPDEYRESGHRPMDPVRMEHYPCMSSPNQPVIKQERHVDNVGIEVHGDKTAAIDHEIRTLTGIISAKEYEVTHFKDYNVHLRKVGNEREFEIDKLKKKLRDAENERDGMEKKWLDQVQNHVKEKYLIADLQKEVLLWKGKFKNLLDRIQGLECDSRRDFDYSCRRSSLGDVSTNDFVHVTNVITSKVPDQRAVVRVQDDVDKGNASVIEGVGHHDGVVHVPVSCAVSRDRVSVPRVYRPEPTYIYGYPSQAIHHVSMAAQNGIPPMKMITTGSEYYDVRRDVSVVNGERPRDVVEENEGNVLVNGEEEKELEIDVDGKMDERMEEVDEDGLNKRLVIGNKAKIIVRKRSDPRFLPKVPSHHKRKRVR